MTSLIVYFFKEKFSHPLRSNNKSLGHQQFAHLILRVRQHVFNSSYTWEAPVMLCKHSCSQVPPWSEWTQSGNEALASVFAQSCTSDSKRPPGIGRIGSPDSRESYPWIWVITTEMKCNWLYYTSIKGLILIQLKYKAERVWDISENKISLWIILTTQGMFRTPSCTLVCKGHVTSNTQLVIPCTTKWKLMPKYLKDCQLLLLQAKGNDSE